MRVLTLFLLAAVSLYAENLPEWFLPLREAVYEQQLTADQVVPLYRETRHTAEQSLSGPPLFVMLSRCEYMMGRLYQFEERKEEAAAHYAGGMDLANKALDSGDGSVMAAAWQMLAENLSQSCAVRSTSFAIANGLNVEKYSKNALAVNSRNAPAQYMMAARWVFAPPPFNNYKKGIAMMEAILAGADLDRDDLFNVHSAIGYAYVQQKKYNEARSWLLKALEIYPTNKYALDLLAKR
ncbi:MAG: tetratricopeptide repeat protein [Treponema sp.]|jgi:tetratricopeptide (TPR) repeat protein|nr:tetratricopeptide repeat protein [Treponema sp.]